MTKEFGPEQSETGLLDIKVLASGGTQTLVGKAYTRQVDDDTYIMYMVLRTDAVSGVDTIPLPVGHDYVFSTSTSTKSYRSLCDFYCDVRAALGGNTHVVKAVTETYGPDTACACQ